MATTTRTVWQPCVVAAAALAVAAATACSSGGGADAKAAPPEGRATVDETTGVIVLPLDRYSLTVKERATVEYGRLLLIRQCMRAKGLDYLVIDRRGEKPQSSRRYGIWVMHEATRYGYVPPPASATEKKILGDNRAKPPAWHDAAIACGQEIGNRAALPDPMPGDVASFKGYPDFMASPEAQAVIEEWRACLREAGVTPPPPDEIYPPDGPNNDLQTQIKVAVVDVQCKQRTRLVHRLAALEADVQGRLISENEAKLNEQRSMLEHVIREAEEAIATTPA